jgi:hypothetical protein
VSDKACPRLTFKREHRTDAAFTGMRITAFEGQGRGRREVGAIFARIEREGWDPETRKRVPITGRPYVTWIKVEKDRCRLGIATQLYTRLARDVCRTYKQPLSSDTGRTEASQAFWAKQVAKGRATCVEPTAAPGPPPDPSWKPTPDVAVEGRGGCLYYQLKSCKVTDLSGRKR